MHLDIGTNINNVYIIYKVVYMDINMYTKIYVYSNRYVEYIHVCTMIYGYTCTVEPLYKNTYEKGIGFVHSITGTEVTATPHSYYKYCTYTRNQNWELDLIFRVKAPNTKVTGQLD